MGIEQYLFAAGRWVPGPVKRALLGKPSSPNRFATAIHSVLNRFSVEEYPILDCGGPLKGFRMRVDWKNHRGFAYGSWEPEVVDAMTRCVPAGMIALDLGAQTGFFSLLLSRLVGPNGRVFAFEPLPANFRVLRENIEINALDNVSPRREAVTDESGRMEFKVPDRDSNLLAGPMHADDEYPTTVVPTISLDDFAREIGRPIEFIKMDVEGAEGLILRGARRLLNGSHPTMLIELHNMDGKTREHGVVDELVKLGYRIQWIGELSWTSHILARWNSDAGGTSRV